MRSRVVLAVCLGTSPSHAWSLIETLAGSSWDLWQVPLEPDDDTHVVHVHGHRLGEVRVRNRIPKRRIWLVGHRTVGSRRWGVA